MIKLIVSLENPPWPELADRNVIHLDGNTSPPLMVAPLKGGMSSGAPSVAFRIDLPDGRHVLAETSLKLLIEAVEIMHKLMHGRGVHEGESDDADSEPKT